MLDLQRLDLGVDAGDLDGVGVVASAGQCQALLQGLALDGGAAVL